MEVVKNAAVLALVSGGADDLTKAEGGAAAVGVGIGYGTSTYLTSIGGFSQVPGPMMGAVGGQMMTGIGAAAVAGYGIGTLAYNHSDTVQDLSGSAVGAVMDAWYNSAVYNCVFRDSGSSGGAGGSIKAADIERMCSE